MRDSALAIDSFGVVARPPVVAEFGIWKTIWNCEQWSEEACDFVRSKLVLPKDMAVSSDLLRKIIGKPEVEKEVVGNLLLNAGIQRMQDMLINTVTTFYYTNAAARIGVGDSSTAEAATQTALQAATNKLLKAMNATFPSRAAQTLTFQSDFTSAEANYVWNEMVIDNGGTNLTCLNRKVASLGTKTTGTWTLSGTVAIT